MIVLELLAEGQAKNMRCLSGMQKDVLLKGVQDVFEDISWRG